MFEWCLHVHQIQSVQRPGLDSFRFECVTHDKTERHFMTFVRMTNLRHH